MSGVNQKYLVVREFDEIKSGDTFDFRNRILKKKDFESLKDFVLENTKTEDDDADSTQFFTCKNGKIKVRNYVGVIELPSGMQIEVLPKVDFGDPGIDDEESFNRSRRIFLKMLARVPDNLPKMSNYTNLESRHLHLFDVFIRMYGNGVDTLVKKGLKSSYVTEEDNLHFYKGKLKVSQHIKYNAAHKERFYMEYDEYQLDRPENKLIKSTLLYLQNKTHNHAVKKQLNQLLNHFELVSPSLNYDADFSKVVNDRNTRDYGDLMMWSKVFLKNKGFTTFHGNSKTRAILFPMEKIFEKYVADEFEERITARDPNWNVSAQNREYNLFCTRVAETGREIGIFRMRPDIVAKNDNRIVILDTKWKNLKDNRPRNYGMSQADMYQMYAYAHKYKTPEIILLYPLNKEMQNYNPHNEHPSKIEFWGDSDDLVGGTNPSSNRIHIKVFFVDLSTIEEYRSDIGPDWVNRLIETLLNFDPS